MPETNVSRHRLLSLLSHVTYVLRALAGKTTLVRKRLHRPCKLPYLRVYYLKITGHTHRRTMPRVQVKHWHMSGAVIVALLLRRKVRVITDYDRECALTIYSLRLMHDSTTVSPYLPLIFTTGVVVVLRSVRHHRYLEPACQAHSQHSNTTTHFMQITVQSYIVSTS